jgi:hypothetical protein
MVIQELALLSGFCFHLNEGLKKQGAVEWIVNSTYRTTCQYQRSHNNEHNSDTLPCRAADLHSYESGLGCASV